MRIRKCILFKPLRLKGSGVEYIEYTPRLPVQTIIGTNGSGKSSLMNELSPLPSDSKDFAKGGYKEIEIEHKGHLYTLKSSFEGATKHSFMKDNEECNPGGTQLVQKELVKQEFGITPDIHQLLIGKKTFTEMSPTEKRQWFTLLSETNFDYSLSVFNKLKEKLRDTQGSLKALQTRLNEETSQLVDESDRKKLEEESQSYHEAILKLTEIRSPVTKDIESLKYQSKKLNDLLDSKSKDLCKITLDITKSKESFSLEDNESQINTIEKELAILEATIRSLEKSYFQIVDNIREIESSQEEDIYQLQNKKNTILESQTKTPSISLEDAVTQYNTLVRIEEGITSTFDDIPSYDEEVYSSKRLHELNSQKENLNIKIQNTQKLLEPLQDNFKIQKHKQNNEPIECPECHHAWTPGFDEEAFAHIEKELSIYSEKINLFEKEKEKVIEDISVIDKYNKTIDSIRFAMQKYPILNPLWDKLNKENLWLLYPKKAITIVKDYILYLEDTKTWFTQQKEIEDTQKVIDKLQKIDKTSYSQYIKNRDLLSEEIQSKHEDVRLLKNTLDKRKSLQSKLTTLFQTKKLVEETLCNKETSFNELKEQFRRQEFNELLKRLQVELSRSEKGLNRARHQKSIIEDIESQIQKTLVTQETLKALVDSLSPTEGLIAQGITSSINTIIELMNQFIEESWNTPLRIESCNTGEEDFSLDYKFSLMNGQGLTPDVKEASNGQKEIVNLAFKIIAMQYLRLKDYPLYLDEYGAFMDELNKSSAIVTVQKLVESESFSQLFIITHHHETYGSMKNSDVLVLCEKNVSTDNITNFNNHVKIKRV